MKKIFLSLSLFLTFNSHCVLELIDDCIIDPLKHTRDHNLKRGIYFGKYYLTKTALILGSNANTLVNIYQEHNNITIDSFRGTALELACRQGHKDIAKLLIENGAIVNKHRSWTSKTPLMNAIKCGSLEIIKLLLENGANLDETNNKGHTALDIAQKKYAKVCSQNLSELDKKKYENVLSYLTNISAVRKLLLINKNYNKLKDLISNDICDDSSKHILSYLNTDDIKEIFNVY